jgi:hypothetical protein
MLKERDVEEKKVLFHHQPIEHPSTIKMRMTAIYLRRK